MSVNVWPGVSAAKDEGRELVAEPIVGWRGWTVGVTGQLKSITYPHTWHPDQQAKCIGTRLAQAITMTVAREIEIIEAAKQYYPPEVLDERVESLRRMRNEAFETVSDGHEAPARLCGCGFWAFKSEESMQNFQTMLYSWSRRHGGWLVTGQVEMWGHLVEHTNGWRAQYARPVGELEVFLEQKALPESSMSSRVFLEQKALPEESMRSSLQEFLREVLLERWGVSTRFRAS